MDFSLTKEQQMLLDSLRDMGKRENFTELAAHIDRTGEFPQHLMAKYADMGLLGMTLSPEYGGEGESALTAILAIEALARYSPMIAAPVFESNVGPVRVIDLFGTPEQKAAIIPGVCRGENSVSVCMTEPEVGSDLTSLQTTVEDKGDHLLLNGRKSFITGGGHASHYLVYCRFGEKPGYKSIGAVIAEKGMPGFSFGKQEEYMGLRGMPSCDLFFDDVKIPKENLLIYRAANGAGQGLPSIYEASLGKCYANEMVREVTDTAMQVFGGYGYSKAFPIERMVRDSRAWGVAGGTLEMLKVTVSSMIFGRRFNQRKVRRKS